MRARVRMRGVCQDSLYDPFKRHFGSLISISPDPAPTRGVDALGILHGYAVVGAGKRPCPTAPEPQAPAHEP